MTPDSIIKACAKAGDVTPEDILCDSRQSKNSWPRHVAAYLIRKRLKRTWRETGQLLGGRDHCTVIYAYNKVDAIVSRIEHYKDAPHKAGGALARIYLAVQAELGDLEAAEKIKTVKIREAAKVASRAQMTDWLRRLKRREQERQERIAKRQQGQKPVKFQKLPYAGKELR